MKTNNLKGGKSDKLTIQDIANKFNVEVDFIKNQLSKGINIETEHTNDKSKATEIAMDHLTEFPDYYNRLEKMEKDAEKDLNESQKLFIKKLLREELEEGKFARTLGTLGMAAATLTAPSVNSMNKNPNRTEKTIKVGVIKNADGSFTSTVKTDGPTKEIAKDLAIEKAKKQRWYCQNN